MANVLLCDSRISDDAALSASTGSGSLPVSALQRKSGVWRPDGLTPWLVADLGAPRDVRSLALVSTAARETAGAASHWSRRLEGLVSAAGTWRIRAADDEDDLIAAPAYDSGEMLFRQSGASDDMPVLVGFHWAADGQAARAYRYWRIDVSDPTNAGGYLDFARLFICGTLPFEHNASYGAGIGYEDASRVSADVSGGLHSVRRVPRPYLDFALEFGSEAEMVGRALDLDRRLGLGGDLLALLNHEAPAHAAQRTVYGSLTALTPVSTPYFKIWAKRYRVRSL